MKQVLSTLATRGFRALADWLSFRAARLSRSRLALWCIVFFLVTGLGQTWILVRGLRGGRPFHAQPAAEPVLVLQRAGSERPVVRDSVLSRLRALKGDTRWDSLLKARPGLADTVRMLERMDSAVWGR